MSGATPGGEGERESFLSIVATWQHIGMVKTLGEALAALPFANSGLVTNATNLTTDYVDVIYLEPEAPTRARWAWADGHMTAFKDHRYIFEGSVPGVYSNTSRVPPSGIRSAPPLGGLASGTVELRADGTFRSWTIENASPAGSTKTAWLDSAAVGMRALSVTTAAVGV